MTGWNAVHRDLRRGDLDALERVLADPTLERTDVARELGELIRSRGRTAWGRSARAEVHGVLLTAVATQPTAARVTATLTRRALVGSSRDLPFDALVRVALTREVRWQGELGLRLLATLTPADADLYPLASALLAATGTPLPDPVPAGAVVGWLDGATAQLHRRPDRTPAAAADALLADPFAVQLLPGIVADGAERALGAQVQVDHRGTSLLPSGIAEISRRGLMDRSALVASAVARLGRGGSAAELRPYTLLLDRLGTTLAEWQPHGRALVELTGSDVGPVVSYAFDVVRRLHGYELIPDDAVVQASATVLRLPAKGTARDSLGLLEAVAGRSGLDAELDAGINAEAVARTAAAGFDHPAHDVAERALDLVARLLPRLTPRAREDLARAAVVIDPALRERVGEVFGDPSPGTGAPAAEVPAVPAVPALPAVATFDRPPPPVRRPWPVVDAEPRDVARLLRGVLGGDLVAWESAFAALVHLRATDPTALRDGVADLEVGGWHGGPHGPAIARRLLREIRDEPLVGLRGSVRSFFSRLTGAVGTDGEPDWNAPDGSLLSPLPHLARLAEAARHLRERPVPMLVATPTHTDGSLAVDILLERLTLAAHGRWEPWPIDLEQALLRTTIPLDGATRLDLARVAHALATPAGTALARWLEHGGLPDPGVTVSRFDAEPTGPHGGRPASWLAPTVTARAAPPGPLTASLLAVPVTGVVQRHVDGSERPSGAIGWLDLVPLPHHPEVQAAWMLPALSFHGDGAGLPSPAALTSVDGRVGVATGAVLAQLLTGGARARTTAVDVALHLAATGQPWGAWTALRLVDAVAHGAVLTRVVDPLRTIAAGGGAREVLVTLVTALPPLVTTAARGLPDLLALTTSLVVEHGVPEHAGPELPQGLRGLAGGRSRAAAEARRLLVAIAPTTG
ncbi:hypothetical protein C8046_15150 [Serinibacter arcticus]|uniref:Secreted protein n=1 Tax=Serinibacter arcticus TaxID=1655435 RepID=A0A2U1ZXY8_9MICO|nr:hypothetical protein [Serinibacter arcticus]PWD51782.1 hypothetical protein C8046_15150 [Serinibacter arcticus]